LELNPKEPTTRLFLRNAHWQRAKILDQEMRQTDALHDWERAIALCEPSAKAWIEVERAVARAQAGDHVTAFAESQALAGMQSSHADLQFQLARAGAACAAAVRDDDVLREKYVVRSVEWLRQAVRKGFKKLAVIQSDPILEPLRDRAEFQQL